VGDGVTCERYIDICCVSDMIFLSSIVDVVFAKMDDYSRRASEQISAAANERIQRVLRETQAAEDALLRDCSSRAIEIENEYNAKLKAFLQELDASKAGNLAALEKDLNLRQQALLDNAKQDMDRIYEQATRQKVKNKPCRATRKQQHDNTESDSVSSVPACLAAANATVTGSRLMIVALSLSVLPGICVLAWNFA